MEKNRYSGIVGELPGKIRLDRYIAETLKLLNRSQIKSRALEAALNGKPVKLSRTVKAGDRLELSWLAAAPVYLAPEPIPLTLIYEDDHCAVINKPQGMVVHPGAGNHSGTLANALLWRHLHRINGGGEAAVPSENVRAGIVHRLDKDTSGVIIAAYDDDSLAMLSAQFKARTARKLYIALVKGTPREAAGSICTRIARNPRDRKRFTALPEQGPGKIALTRYRLLKSWGDYALLLLKPRTGRTHQLRVHLAHIGHPILGDPLYASPDKRFPAATLMLHAYSLRIVLPQHHEPSCFKAPLPERFRTTIAALN
ncbi:MAG: RluA family pseudouridine synthase [Spirochaetaceae bacterium]|jgi:23S rRNA pseudouridine1911/1915/1917 synthase|nr:RluA family pseudouridine synthase [Spirochaetaceae bacterium]